MSEHRPPSATVEALVVAIAKVARKACRNGEEDKREWPSLAELPFFESWRCVGETYAESIMVAMYEKALVEIRELSGLTKGTAAQGGDNDCG